MIWVNEMFEDLKILVDYIQTVYDDITDNWINSEHAKVNLKRTLVSDLESEGTVYQNIMDYTQLLKDQSTFIVMELSVLCTCPVTARIKTKNSIEFKIQKYKTESHEFGKIPVNKCINDLFGVRIVLEEPADYETIQAFIEGTYGGRYKCIDSSKGEYKATHIYFRRDNLSFPWELQIWNKVDVDENFKSHKRYKQDYTVWEKESKEGGLIDG